MTHQNLILTEEAIKAHSKRLQKELKKLNQDLPLTQVQNLLSKAFGFNNFYELKEIFKNEKINNKKYILNKIIPEHYKKNSITKKKENMLEHVLLDELEIVQHKIPQEFINLVDVILTSNLEKVITYIENNKIDLNYQIPGRNWQPKNILEFAIFFEQYNILKYLIESKNINLNNSHEYLIHIESKRNNIKNFKYLCSILPYTQDTLNMSLLYSTSGDNIEIVKYLLTSKELKLNANIHFRSDKCLKNAIDNGKLNIVKYLLTSDDLLDKPSLFSISFHGNSDLRNDIIHKIKIYTNELKDRDGNISKIEYSQLEKDNFFAVLNYLIKDYGDNKFVNWLYVKKELRSYINKNDIDIEALLKLME